jgi:glycosyltransferase involved in cell wall biosynthesis
VAEIEEAVQKRLLAGKPVFRVSERLYKTGRWRFISPRGLLHKYRLHTRHQRRSYYLLCAGSFVAGDFRLFGAFPRKKYRWGYFPAIKRYGEELWQKKAAIAPIQICWAGRFIWWKRPEEMLRLIRDLNEAGEAFHLHMIGSGTMDSELKQLALDFKVESLVTFHGACPPQRVREIMEESHIYVLTSNRQEGWGAVLNEAMNSGLAVVASVEAGATGYLICNGENGLCYKNGDYATMRLSVQRLLADARLRERLGRKAYHTIVSQWNAEHAVEELLRVSQDILAGKEIVPALAGPLSKA